MSVRRGAYERLLLGSRTVHLSVSVLDLPCPVWLLCELRVMRPATMVKVILVPACGCNMSRDSHSGCGIDTILRAN